MNYLSIKMIEFLMLVFFYRNVVSSGIKSHLELNSINKNATNDTLIFAHIIYRHGERHTEGTLQLTNEGKRQLYTSGEYFHRRYGKVLGNKYSPDKMNIISTEHDRTIMSAQANLAGWFVPTGEEVWNQELLWQPIPVHILPKKEDNLLYNYKKCPKQHALYEYYSKNLPEGREIYAKYGHLFSYWEKMSGIEIRSFDNIAFLYKKLLTDAGQNISIPVWAKEDLPKMAYIRETNYKIRRVPQLVRLKSGFLIQDILNRFSQKINGTLKPDRIIWVYAAHSSTIKLLLDGLGLSELTFPDYGSSLLWELYKTPENTYYTQLFYRQLEEEHPAPLSLPRCGQACTVEHFRSVYDAIIADDFDTECQINVNTTKYKFRIKGLAYTELTRKLRYNSILSFGRQNAILVIQICYKK